jgi:hypothetical protein
LAQVRHRVEEVYLDKLHGKISEAFWEAKTSEGNQEEHQIRNHWHKNLRTVRNRDWRARKQISARLQQQLADLERKNKCINCLGF